MDPDDSPKSHRSFRERDREDSPSRRSRRRHSRPGPSRRRHSRSRSRSPINRSNSPLGVHSDKPRRLIDRDGGLEICLNCDVPGHLHSECPFRRKPGGSSRSSLRGSPLRDPSPHSLSPHPFANDDYLAHYRLLYRTMLLRQDTDHDADDLDGFTIDPEIDAYERRLKELLLRGQLYDREKEFDLERQMRRERNRLREEMSQLKASNFDVHLFIRDTLKQDGKNAQVLREVHASQGYEAMIQVARVLMNVNQGKSSYSSSSSKRHDDDRHHRSEKRERRDDEDRDRGEIPNKTIMIRNLPSFVTESEIEEEVRRSKLKPLDVRLMRTNKGLSRGFAFVEFSKLSDAVRWKEVTKGVVKIGGSRCLLHYGVNTAAGRGQDFPRTDWICFKCNITNFKHRVLCFMCNKPRPDSNPSIEEEATHEASKSQSNTLLLRNLDVLTTEETVLNALSKISKLSIKSIKIAKDPLLNVSKGTCILEMNDVKDATKLLAQIHSNKLKIDDRKVEATYARPAVHTSTSSAAMLAVEAAQWSNQPTAGSHSLATTATAAAASSVPAKKALPNLGTVMVNGVAYPKYPVPDVQTFLYDSTSGFYYDPQTGFYYDGNSQYFYVSETQQYMYWDGEKQTYLPAPPASSTTTVQTTVQSSSTTSTTSTAATVNTTTTTATSSTVSTTSETTSNSETTSVPSTTENTTTTTVIASTNAVISAAPTVAPKTETPSLPPETAKVKLTKQDKAKIAQKIAKDMEKWAKAQNQKKVLLKPKISLNSSSGINKSSAAADAGFAVLAKKSSAPTKLSDIVLSKPETEAAAANPSPLSALSLFNQSDSEPEEPPAENKKDTKSSNQDTKSNNKDEQESFIDWVKMACLLCKRQFPSKDGLSKHLQFSDLHKKNLQKLKNPGTQETQAETKKNSQSPTLSRAPPSFPQGDLGGNYSGNEVYYRDRARERREKFGNPDDEIQSNTMRESVYNQMVVIDYEQPTKEGIGSDNIGNRMMRMMGWSEGQGLGKDNRGPSDIVEVTNRIPSAGLGLQGANRPIGNSGGPFNYRAEVKKALHARYYDIP